MYVCVLVKLCVANLALHISHALCAAPAINQCEQIYTEQITSRITSRVPLATSGPSTLATVDVHPGLLVEPAPEQLSSNQVSPLGHGLGHKPEMLPSVRLLQDPKLARTPQGPRDPLHHDRIQPGQQPGQRIGIQQRQIRSVSQLPADHGGQLRPNSSGLEELVRGHHVDKRGITEYPVGAFTLFDVLPSLECDNNPTCTPPTIEQPMTDNASDPEPTEPIVDSPDSRISVDSDTTEIIDNTVGLETIAASHQSIDSDTTEIID